MANPFKDYIVKLRTGDLVFKEGDPGTEMYIVQSGQVEIFQETRRGTASLAVMEKGDFFGEMALLDGAPHAASARVLQDAELIEINSTLFDRMIRGNVEIAVRMLRKLSIRLREANKKYEGLLAAAGGGGTAAEEAATRSPVPPAAVAAAVAATPEAEKAPEIEKSPELAKTPDLRATRAPSEAAAPAPLPPPAPLPAVDGCHAFLLSEDGKETFPISGAKAAIGRYDPVTGLKPEVDLTEVDINRSVSRHHARLSLEGGIYYLCEEPGALNGTFINGRKLITGKPTRVKDGDAVIFGMVKLLFREAGKA